MFKLLMEDFQEGGGCAFLPPPSPVSVRGCPPLPSPHPPCPPDHRGKGGVAMRRHRLY